MAGVLTTASTVDCGHGGTVAAEGIAKLKVAGSPVLLEAGVAGKSVAATCALVDSADASGTPITLKCIAVMTVTAGKASKLKVADEPVLLDTLAGGTTGMSVKGTTDTALHANAVQTKLKAV